MSRQVGYIYVSPYTSVYMHAKLAVAHQLFSISKSLSGSPGTSFQFFPEGGTILTDFLGGAKYEKTKCFLTWGGSGVGANPPTLPPPSNDVPVVLCSSSNMSMLLNSCQLLVRIYWIVRNVGTLPAGDHINSTSIIGS